MPEVVVVQGQRPHRLQHSHSREVFYLRCLFFHPIRRLPLYRWSHVAASVLVNEVNSGSSHCSRRTLARLIPETETSPAVTYATSARFYWQVDAYVMTCSQTLMLRHRHNSFLLVLVYSDRDVYCTTFLSPVIWLLW